MDDIIKKTKYNIMVDLSKTQNSHSIKNIVEVYSHYLQTSSKENFVL